MGGVFNLVSSPYGTPYVGVTNDFARRANAASAPAWVPWISLREPRR